MRRNCEKIYPNEAEANIHKKSKQQSDSADFLFIIGNKLLRTCIFFLLLFPTFLTSNETSTAEELVSIQGESSALIWDCVNAITGDLYFSQCDGTISGARPIPFYRTYISREVKNSNLRWDPTRLLLARWIFRNSVCEIVVPEPNGIFLSYFYFPKVTKKEKLLELPADLSPHGKVFERGLVHLSYDAFGNLYDPRNNVLNLQETEFVLRLSNGGMRTYVLYGEYKLEDPVHNFLLKEESLPNGTKVHYEWGADYVLKSISTMNPSKTKTYAHVEVQINHPAEKFMSIAFGPRLSYVFKNKKLAGKGKKVPFLKQAITPEFPVEKIQRTKEQCYLSQRIFPNGRVLTIKYDKKGRVTRLLGPENTSCNIKYRKEYTEVVDHLGNLTFYFFDPDTLRLSEIQFFDGNKNLIKKQTFQWTDTGLIEEKTFENRSETFLTTAYTYDENSNILTKTVSGKITDDNAYNEQYTIAYTYDSLNRLIEEKEGNGRVTEYQYLDSTNLPTLKLVRKDYLVIEKTQCAYNNDNILIYEITDDGFEQHIKRITPRPEEPFYGMPAIIEELYQDGEEEVLFKRTAITYDDRGNIVSKTIYGSDNEPKFTLYTEYTTQDQIKSETDALGNKTQYEYDENGNKIKEITPLGRIIKFEYDKCNRLTQKKEIGKDQTYITQYQDFDVNNQPKTIIDPLDKVTKRTYDPLGNVLQTTDSTGGTTTHTYNVLGQKISTTDPNGNTTKITHNIYGKPLVITHPDGTEETFTYSLDGNQKTHTNQSGITKTYHYDPYGNIDEEHIDGVEKILFRKYNASHLLEEINLEGYKTTYSYDPSGLLKEKTYAGKTTIYFYDTLGRCIQEVTDDYILEKTYDNLNRVIQQREYSDYLLLTQTQSEYDPINNPIKIITYPNNEPAITIIKYDSFGREILHIDPLEQTTYTAYQIHDRQFLKIVTEPGNIQTIETYNALNQLISLEKRNPQGQLIAKTAFEYDLNGNQILQKTTIFQDTTLLSEHTIAYSYDSMNRKETETESSARIIQYTYTPTGKLYTLTKPDGTILTYTYSSLDHLTSLTSSKSDIAYTYTHDKLGRLLSSTDATGATTTRILDPHGNILRETLANGYSLTSTYDTSSRRITLALPNHHTIQYTYLGPFFHTVSAHHLLHQYHYDFEGNIISEDFIDGTPATYQYDPLSRPTVFSSAYFTQECEYSPRGNIISFQCKNKHQQFTYDDLDHLIEEPAHAYTYDSLHNRQSKDKIHYSHNTLNQIESPNLEYDPNGNLIRMNEIKLCYDSLDRLIQVITPTQTFTYTYDSEHRRISKNDTHYIWDGNHELGTSHHYRVLGPTSNAEIRSAIVIYIDEVPYIPIHDLQGNLIQVHNLDGSSYQAQAFTAFGEGANIMPWGFSSKRHDPETNLIYFGRRYYDPNFGRFITTDPEGYTDTANLYAYCQNNPLTNSDPYGLMFAGSTINLLSNDPNNIPSWEDLRQQWMGQIHAPVQWAVDRTLNLAHYAGGIHGPEDMSFLETYNLSSEANKHWQSTSERWFQDILRADPNNPIYRGSFDRTYQGLDIAESFLPFGAGKLKAPAKAIKATKRAIDAQKASRVFRSTFQSRKTGNFISSRIELNRFHQAASNLSEVGQNDIRILRNWAKSKSWERYPNPQGGPEKWGTWMNGEFEWRLRIKPEPSFRKGLHPNSGYPRFDARLKRGGHHYVNPFTGQIGKEEIGTHLPLLFE